MGKKIGYVGLGLMGKGMAKNLMKKGHFLTVLCHQNRKPVEEFLSMGAKEASSPRELAEMSEVVILTVPGSPEVEDVILGNKGMIEGVGKGFILIDCSTSYPPSTRMIAEKLEAKSAEMLDAPLTRGPKEASEGRLNIMVGGKREVYDNCMDIFDAMGENIFYVGGHGAGNVVKLVNNLLGLSSLATTAEVLPMAVKFGVDPKAIYDVIGVSGGWSRYFDAWVPKIMERDFSVSFELNLAYKDLTYVTNLARELNAPLPMGNMTTQVFEIARSMGLGKENLSSVVKVWEKILGVEVRKL